MREYMISRFEKRILAGIMSGLMILSCPQMGAVYASAEEMTETDPVYEQAAEEETLSESVPDPVYEQAAEEETLSESVSDPVYEQAAEEETPSESVPEAVYGQAAEGETPSEIVPEAVYEQAAEGETPSEIVPEAVYEQAAEGETPSESIPEAEMSIEANVDYDASELTGKWIKFVPKETGHYEFDKYVYLHGDGIYGTFYKQDGTTVKYEGKGQGYHGVMLTAGETYTFCIDNTWADTLQLYMIRLLTAEQGKTHTMKEFGYRYIYTPETESTVTINVKNGSCLHIGSARSPSDIMSRGPSVCNMSYSFQIDYTFLAEPGNDYWIWIRYQTGENAEFELTEDPIYQDYGYHVMDDGNVRIVKYFGEENTTEVPSEIEGKPVTKLSKSVFWERDCAAKHAVIPSSVELEEGQFYASRLESIEFAEGTVITEIPDDAFASCRSLVKLVIPAKITSIGKYAFGDDRMLSELDVDLSELKTIGESAFIRTDSLPDLDLSQTKLESIGALAFSESGIKNIVLPETLTTLDSYAFSDSKIENVSLPDSLVNMGERVFGGCKELKTCKTGNGIEKIPYATFTYSTLKDVLIGSGVKTIGEQAFAYDEVMTEVTIPDNVTRIEYLAFYQCKELADVKLPKTIEYIGYDAFTGTKWLENQADGYVTVNDKVLYQYKGQLTEAKVEIPEGMTSISGAAFRGQKALEEVVIPSSVKSIGRYAFAGCGMKSVTIPGTVTEIESDAFGYDIEDHETWVLYTKKEDFVIRGEKGSAAEKYAQRYDFTFEPTNDMMRGDLTGDGEVTIQDLRMMLRAVCKKVTLTDEQIRAGDVTGGSDPMSGDGEVTINDLRRLLRFICGKLEIL